MLPIVCRYFVLPTLRKVKHLFLYLFSLRLFSRLTLKPHFIATKPLYLRFMGSEASIYVKGLVKFCSAFGLHLDFFNVETHLFQTKCYYVNGYFIPLLFLHGDCFEILLRFYSNYYNDGCTEFCVIKL
jgi:hypothetical protein